MKTDNLDDITRAIKEEEDKDAAKTTLLLNNVMAGIKITLNTMALLLARTNMWTALIQSASSEYERKQIADACTKFLDDCEKALAEYADNNIHSPEPNTSKKGRQS
jgi:hypothetical protein